MQVSRRLAALAVRRLVWLCLLLTLLPDFGAAANPPAPSSVPIVSKLSGAVSIQGRNGVSNDVISSRVIHSGDLLITGVDSLALINLADVGSVRIGPTSTAKAFLTSDGLTVNITSGSACAEALTKGVNVIAGGLALSAADQNAIFSLTRTQDGTTLAVYQGTVTARIDSSPSETFKAGEAAATSGNSLQQVGLGSVQSSFTALQCPDQAIIAQATQLAGSSSGGHGGGGGILAALLGLGAIAAAAGGHGGGGGSSTPPPTPSPGTLSVNKTSLSLELKGSAQPFTASETNYTGPIDAVSSDTSVATVSPASASGPSAQFAVTPVGNGSTVITVTDNHGGQQVVNVTVAPPGPIQLVPNSLTLVVGAPPQTFQASESNYQGPLNAVSNDTTVATVTGSGNGPGPVTFTVTPVGAGTTTITVSGGAAPQTVSVTVKPPGSIDVNPGSLTFRIGGPLQTFQASESNYQGPLNAVSNDTTVATVTGSGNGPGPVTFTVTPVGAGTTTITVSGGSAPATVDIAVVGPLTTNVNSLNFPGTPASQNFTATDPFYKGVISASSDDTGVATVAPVGSSIGPGPVTFAVTPVGAGSAHITVSDAPGDSAVVSVSVSSGTLKVNPSTLAFTVGGPDQTFTGQEDDYTGSIFASSTDTSLATVSPASGPGPGPVVFTVHAVAAGNPIISVSDNHGGSKLVHVTITGAIMPSPTSFDFTDVGAGAAQSLTVSESNYSGTFTVNDTNCSGIASVNPSTSTGNFTVTPNGQGNCNLTITDTHSSPSVQVGVTVGPFGATTPTTSILNLKVSDGTGSFMVTESGYTGNFTLNDSTCVANGAATVSPLSGNQSTTFTVTPGASANNCKVTITDDASDPPGTVDVFVTGGTLIVNPNTLTFPSNSTGTMPFNASDTACGALDTITATPDGTFAASVSPSGPQLCTGGVTFTVTAGGTNGQGFVTVTDTVGGSATVSVGVGMSPLRKNHRPMAVHKALPPAAPIVVHKPLQPITSPAGPISRGIGGPAALPLPTVLRVSTSNLVLAMMASQPITLSESGYTRTFSIVSSNPNVAAVNMQSASGPSATIVVTGLAAGISTIRVTDDHGGVALIQVFVRPSGPKGSLLHPRN